MRWQHLETSRWGAPVQWCPRTDEGLDGGGAIVHLVVDRQVVDDG